jgi:hypothetical protein
LILLANLGSKLGGSGSLSDLVMVAGEKGIRGFLLLGGWICGRGLGSMLLPPLLPVVVVGDGGPRSSVLWLPLLCSAVFLLLLLCWPAVAARD